MKLKNYKNIYWKWIKIIIILFIIFIIVNLHFKFQKKNDLIYNSQGIEKYNSTITWYQYYLENNAVNTIYFGDLGGLKEESLIKINETLLDINNESFIFIKNINNLNYIGANSKNIIIKDNFCSKNWSNITNKNIYLKTSFSPGLRCFSEIESIEINNIINSFQIRNAIIFYDSKEYLNSIGNVKNYLNEKNIEIQLIEIK